MSNKGEYRGECRRAACSNTNANYYNHSTSSYYCVQCAREINRWAPEFLAENGYELCVFSDKTDNGVKVGDVITAYKKGIHKVVKIEQRFYDSKYMSIPGKKTGDEYNSLVYYKTLINSKGKEVKSDKIDVCDAAFCNDVSIFLNEEKERINKIEKYLKCL